MLRFGCQLRRAISRIRLVERCEIGFARGNERGGGQRYPKRLAHLWSSSWREGEYGGHRRPSSGQTPVPGGISTAIESREDSLAGSAMATQRHGAKVRHAHRGASALTQQTAKIIDFADRQRNRGT